jgi:hypothetical protein
VFKRVTGSTLTALASLFLVTPAFAFDHAHSQLDKVLRAHVKQGQVNYGDLARHRAELDGYVAGLAAVSLEQERSFSPRQAKAFWINAYNALTLKLILDEKPRTSIRDIDQAWDRPRFEVAGREVSLNDIEHKILRPRFKDPRLHAVLVCAARSCPILEAKVFRAKGLERRLEAANRRFARDKSRNRFDQEAKVIYASRIFEWYGDDYIARYAKTGGGEDKLAAVRGFFIEEVGAPAAAAGGAELRYLDYDWSLNGNW